MPRPAALAGNLLHPLAVTSDGIYGAINQRQARLVQPVTGRHALGDLGRLLASGARGWLASGGGPSPPRAMLSFLITASSEAGAQPVGQAHPPAPIPRMRKLRLNRGNVASCFFLWIALGRGFSA